MNNQRIKKIICCIIAAVCAAALLAGCSGADDQAQETTASQASSDTTSAPEDQEGMSTTRPIAEGDDYAINKISCKTEGEEFPGGYKLVNYNEVLQGKHFANNESKIIIRAGNYAEDFPDLATWADSTSAGIVLSNITNNATDTDFGEPENVKVCGFDAIRYDCEMIQYAFENDENGEEKKVEVARYLGRNYYFYSDQDVYAIMFDTKKDDWEEQLPKFEEFIADLQITKTEY